MIAIFPEIASASASCDIERLAVLVRKYFGGDETYAPQPDVARLVRHAGLTVSHLTLDCQAALVAKDEKGSFKIAAILREPSTEVSARFTLAHLLGHFLLDLQPLIARGDCLTSGYRENDCPLRRYSLGTKEAANAVGQERKELLSDDFAAALLMPKGMVTRAMKKLNDAEKTAAFFGVTKACLMRRLTQVGMTEDKPTSFLHAEQKLGLKVSIRPKLRSEEASAELKAPPTEAAMPRSYAASTYGQTARSTATELSTAPEPKASVATVEKAPVKTAEQAPSATGQGMDRIRQLAKLLDKSMR